MRLLSGSCVKEKVNADELTRSNVRMPFALFVRRQQPRNFTKRLTVETERRASRLLLTPCLGALPSMTCDLSDAQGSPTFDR